MFYGFFVESAGLEETKDFSIKIIISFLFYFTKNEITENEKVYSSFFDNYSSNNNL